jgi:hypothetical protein
LSKILIKIRVQAQSSISSNSSNASTAPPNITFALAFLRPDMALGYKVPIAITEISRLDTIQAKWCKIIAMAQATPPSA